MKNAIYRTIVSTMADTQMSHMIQEFVNTEVIL